MGNRRPPPPGPASPGDGTPSPAEAALLDAFHALRDELVSTLAFVLGNREDARDAAQEAFLKCWKARDGVAGVQNLRAWVFRVAMNTARDVRRSAWSRKVKPLLGEEPMFAARDAAPDQTLEDRETLDRLRDAIAGLRPDEQEVFLLRQNGELTYEQIADVRGAPVGTVKTQMRSALIKLRKVLNPSEPNEVGSPS